MQISSENPSKRSRAKAKPKEAPPILTTRKSRKTTAESVAAVQRPLAELDSMIATTAYFLAAERNFAPGQELADWLEAERRVRSKML